jgi:hypothetical protein
MEANMKTIKALPLILILFGLTGCHYSTSKHAEELDDFLYRLVVGSSTRKEVISFFGPPHASSAGTISYFNLLYSEATTGVIHWGAPFKPTRGHSPAQYINLSFEFDNNGRLTQFSQIPSLGRDTIQDCLSSCNADAGGCFVSINEAESTSKGELRCEKEKQICLQKCETQTYETDPIEHDDCDPGMESCD